MTVTVNGAPYAAGAGATLAEVVYGVTDRPTGVAVALNDAVVPRGEWPATALREGDRVEILTAVQGG